MEIIRPKKENSITVCFASDNNYIFYLAVAIKSLIENSNENNYYEIYILTEEISDLNQEKILDMQSKNIYIEFVFVNKYFEELDKELFFIDGRISIATYYRFFIPFIFKNFKKILYLDSDIIILNDISKLFYEDMKNKAIAAVLDYTLHLKLLYNNDSEEEFDFNDYITNTLKINDKFKYFNAGIMIFDINKLLEIDFYNICINKLKILQTPKFYDQCVMNSEFQDNIHYLPYNWNLTTTFYNHFDTDYKYPDYINKIYENIKDINNIHILHYSVSVKPWINPNTTKSNIWWKYARLTSFYEDIIYKNNRIVLFDNIRRIEENIVIKRFNIADFIFSMCETRTHKIFTILGIKISIRKK